MKPVLHAKPHTSKSPHTCHHHIIPHTSLNPPSIFHLPPLHLYHKPQITTTMATTYDRPHQTTTTTHTTHQPYYRYDRNTTSGNRLPYPQPGPSGSKIMAIMALLPIGGILLGLAGITLVGTMIGLAVATPVFVIFSPVIVPAILTLGLAVTGFLTSGTFGLTGLSSLSYLVNMLRQSTPSLHDQIEYAKGTVQDVGMYAGQKTKEAGQTIQNKAHEMGQTGGGGGGGGGGGVGITVTAGGGKEGGKGGDRT